MADQGSIGLFSTRVSAQPDAPAIAYPPANVAQIQEGQLAPLDIGQSFLRLAGPANREYETVRPAAAYRVAGVVKEYGVNVARQVRAYRRDNGVLLGGAVSDGATGVFSIPIYGYNGEVFVVAFDDHLLPALNAMVLDSVLPV